MKTTTEEALLQEARSHLDQFALITNRRYEIARHHEYLIQELEELISGGNTRLIVTMPPRHGKTELCGKLLPAYFLGKHPEAEVIYASYNQERSNDIGRKVRNLMSSPLYSRLFPGSVVSDDSSARHAFSLLAGGAFIAAGMGGSITGRGGELVILDDLIKGSVEARSSTNRTKIKEWYGETLYPRLQGQEALVVLGTRWHIDDPIGWLLKEHKQENWKVVNFPAIAEEDDLFRLPGEALWPSRFPLEKLLRRQAAMSQQAWLAEYQQRPTVGTGYLFKREWFANGRNRYDPSNNPSAYRSMNLAILVDPANDKKKTSDYTAMFVVGANEDGNYWILDMVRDRLSITERIDKLFELHKKYRLAPNIEVGYERYGASADVGAIEAEMDRRLYHFDITALPREGTANLSKPDRIGRLQPAIRNGRIKLPLVLWRTNNEGLEEDLAKIFIEQEYNDYPAVDHDDMLDALARLFDIDLEFPLYNQESAAFKAFEQARNIRERGLTPWAS